MSSASTFVGLHHVQLSAPTGCEPVARRFYGELLGLREIEKPSALAARGGVWFECGDHQLHIGVEPDFHAARKAHPAFQLINLTTLNALEARLELEGVEIQHDDETFPGYRRFYVRDPFDNRLEFICPAY
jgi:catechol 2,3-dioxygenase-like lactoylglutathione lyase family enzyme